MEKDLIKRIITNPSEKDIVSFVTYYVKEEKDIDLTPIQLENILILIKFGAFNLNEAIKKACAKAGLTFISLFDKEGKFLKNYVYE